MLKVDWARSNTAKRGFALLVLAYFSYVGFMRCVGIVHVDRCHDAGGVYDAASDVCRR